MNLDKNNIIEQAKSAARKAVDVVTLNNTPVNKAMDLAHDSAMAVLDQVADAEMAKVGSIEVKKGEGAKEMLKGGLQFMAGAVKTQVESSAKGLKGVAKGMGAAKDLMKGDTESAKAKIIESTENLADAVAHGTIGQVRNAAQAFEREYKGAKQLGKEILGLEQVQTDWAYERSANNNGWYMSDAA